MWVLTLFLLGRFTLKEIHTLPIHLYLSVVVKRVLHDDRAVAWAKSLGGGGQFTHCLRRAPPSFSMWCMYDLEISGGQLPPDPMQGTTMD